MKQLVVLALAAGLLASASAPSSAGDLSPGGAAALGALGGFALGAAVGATAQPLPPPPPRAVYVEPAPRRVYVEPKRVYVERAPRRVYVERPVEETCVVERERVWVPGWGWEVRRRTVCD
jgi:hypothetical protein